MTKDDLRKLDKETLVEFIFEDSIFRRDQSMPELKRIEKNLQFEKLMAKSREIGEEMRKCTGLEHIKTFSALMKKDARIQKQIDKILNL